jgi:4-amino-4-deoxy-L-arabinose transferase-like glycosyltransferase
MVTRARPGAALALVTCAVGVYGVFCTVLLGLERAIGMETRTAALIAGLAAAGVLLAASRHGRLADLATRVMGPLGRVRARCWVLLWIAVGSVLRLVWAVVVPPIPASDHLAYLTLAVNLIERGRFWLGHDCLYLPPGISLAMAPLIAALGDHPLVPLAFNLLLFAVALPASYLLARRLVGDDAARVSVVLLAVWPNLIMLAGFASKELLVFALLPTVLLLTLQSAAAPARWSLAWSAGTGLLLGAMVLTQPHTALLVPVLAAFEWLRGGPRRAALVRLVVVVVAAGLAVLPWTVRNYLVSGELVAVSANGGHSLWVGNNPRATGGYIPVRPDWAEAHEVAYDRAARGWALSWIRANPGAFLRLVPRKQVLYLGDDAAGAYWAVKEGLGIRDVRYALAKGTSNAFWIAILGLAVVGAWAWRNRLAAPTLALLALPMVLQLGLFSITESGGRHHVQLAALLAILAALALTPAARRCASRGEQERRCDNARHGVAG